MDEEAVFSPQYFEDLIRDELVRRYLAALYAGTREAIEGDNSGEPRGVVDVQWAGHSWKDGGGAIRQVAVNDPGTGERWSIENDTAGESRTLLRDVAARAVRDHQPWLEGNVRSFDLPPDPARIIWTSVY